ncbi:sugar transferase [Euzebya tangerina]|uniref:sugar transferase n=1 Tax=Euzebya tangerina TaxID=591198 RepID=UPI000E31778F|nr:sugar transferase [Euzebya tangerina]
MATTTRRHATPVVLTPVELGAPVSSTYVRLVKPVIDRLVALLALILLLPLFAVVAMGVYTSLGAPLIFGQERVGLGGRSFTVYKFRSMNADRRRTAATFDGFDRRRTHKSEQDPRLTPTGRLIRRLSLDELPQLINVLRGDMSLVGPRPELPGIVEEHYAEWMHRRHAVKPGMTGLWQVSERGNGMMHEHVDVDLDYVDQVGLGTDMRILAKTLPAALHTNQGV